ncbi:hypothetical protein ACS8Y6_16425 [Salinisphaera sp. RV14]|uniref:hypothetical protein n=1 Tax=Salinisphaera sp. RV14 TaxID=3454140 RepID=UPI003F879E74
MATADGHLLRLRPPDSALDARMLRALARIADCVADGGVRVTRRAKIELRGVTAIRDAMARLDSADLREARRDAGVPDTIISAASDIDDNAEGDAITLARGLRAAMRQSDVTAALADKFALVVDGGGRAHLGSIDADIRLDALAGRPGVWRLAVAGDSVSATPLACLAACDVPAAVTGLMTQVVAGNPPPDRGLRLRGLDPARIARAAAQLSVSLTAAASGAITPRIEYPLERRRGANWQSFAFPFGRIESRTLGELARLARTHGPIRLFPDRSLVVAAGGEALRERLRRLGAIVSSADPHASIEACVGQRGCAHGSTDTRAHALLCSHAMPNLRAAASGTAVHVSGCSKGCARRRPAAVTLVGRGGRYDVVFAGGPAAIPSWTGLAPAEVVQRLAALDRAFVEQGRSGESAEAFVARHGPAAV